MSWEAFEWARRVPDLSYAELKVLLVLASYHDAKTGRCDPSLATIGAECGVRGRWAQRCLASMQEKRVFTRDTTGGRKQATRYLLPIPLRPPKPGAEEPAPPDERANGTAERVAIAAATLSPHGGRERVATGGEKGWRNGARKGGENGAKRVAIAAATRTVSNRTSLRDVTVGGGEAPPVPPQASSSLTLEEDDGEDAEERGVEAPEPDRDDRKSPAEVEALKRAALERLAVWEARQAAGATPDAPAGTGAAAAAPTGPQLVGATVIDLSERLARRRRRGRPAAVAAAEEGA